MAGEDESDRKRDGRRADPDRPALPDILSLEIRLVRFDEPRVTQARGTRLEHHTALAFQVETSAELREGPPAPVLFVGHARVEDREPLEEARYVFYGYEPKRYEEGAPIGLGWADEAGPRMESGFRYSAPTPRG